MREGQASGRRRQESAVVPSGAGALTDWLVSLCYQWAESGINAAGLGGFGVCEPEPLTPGSPKA